MMMIRDATMMQWWWCVFFSLWLGKSVDRPTLAGSIGWVCEGVSAESGHRNVPARYPGEKVEILAAGHRDRVRFLRRGRLEFMPPSRAQVENHHCSTAIIIIMIFFLLLHIQSCFRADGEQGEEIDWIPPSERIVRVPQAVERRALDRTEDIRAVRRIPAHSSPTDRRCQQRADQTQDRSTRSYLRPSGIISAGWEVSPFTLTLDQRKLLTNSHSIMAG